MARRDRGVPLAPQPLVCWMSAESGKRRDLCIRQASDYAVMKRVLASG